MEGVIDACTKCSNAVFSDVTKWEQQFTDRVNAVGSVLAEDKRRLNDKFLQPTLAIGKKAVFYRTLYMACTIAYITFSVLGTVIVATGANNTVVVENNTVIVVENNTVVVVENATEFPQVSPSSQVTAADNTTNQTSGFEPETDAGNRRYLRGEDIGAVPETAASSMATHEIAEWVVQKANPNVPQGIITNIMGIITMLMTHLKVKDRCDAYAHTYRMLKREASEFLGNRGGRPYGNYFTAYSRNWQASTSKFFQRTEALLRRVNAVDQEGGGLTLTMAFALIKDIEVSDEALQAAALIKNVMGETRGASVPL
jgi:hypothetical protein